MTSVFSHSYASSYDLLYADKDYLAECDAIERLISTYGLKPTRSILDLGCGTGNHCIPLAQRGYDVVGIDRSEEMLARARLKGRTSATFESGDIRSADLKRTFDCALMMFAVLGYQLENQDALAALKNARRHLKAGGLLIFDIWYGPAVVNVRPSERAKVIPFPGGQVIRCAQGALESARQVCRVDYQMWRIEKDHVVSRTEESHQMRYFFPLEIELLVNFTGFRLLGVGAFPEFENAPDENTWNVIVVAKAV